MTPHSNRVTQYLKLCEPAVSGQHGHDRTFAIATKLTWGFGLSVEQAWPFMDEYNRRCSPPWSEHDLRRKLDQALRHPEHTKPRGYLLGSSAGSVPMSMPLPKPEPLWPQPDLLTINKIVCTGPGLYDLWEQSPVQLGGSGSHAEEIVDILFPGNPLLCCAKSNREFVTRRREAWRGRLKNLPVMVPNPMLSVNGQTQSGRTSEHTKEATARRVYQVIEFDFSAKDKRGNNTIWTPLIRMWADKGIEIADACACLLLYLREQLPTLVCCTHSGGKSLHGWFRVLDKLTSTDQKQFMRLAVSLGADRATWIKSQFVRIPDGRRDNGKPQTCYYLNPKEAVMA
jgi:hypothetical protein